MTYFTSPVMDDWQRQIIFGTILGGSSIVKPNKGKNCYLFMRSANTEWLIYKAQELKAFSSQRPFTEEGSTLRWHSNCYPIFNEFRDIFYNGKEKIITMDILNELRDIGLAIWFGDCGKIRGTKIWLNTHKYGKEGTELIGKYFNEVGVECDAGVERKNNRIIMSEAGSEKFMRTIAHRLPDFMLATLKFRRLYTR